MSDKKRALKGEKEQMTRGASQNKSKIKTAKRKIARPTKRLLEVNTKVKSKTKRSWLVLAHIGSGGFGDVYKVCDDTKPSMECAMKTEIHEARQRRLNIEKNILKEIDQYTAAHKKTRHFCELIDSGQTVEFSWLTMTLIGPSLDNVRRMLKRQFSKSCVVSMAIQILDAVEIMHEVGFIHRDLKPGNICTGVPPNDENVLYVLDFGISRRIFKHMKSRELRNKRERVPFYGTRKFCTRACHWEKDQGRKDDMETFVYTILDLFHNEKGLPWSRDLQTPKKIIEKKKALFENPQKTLDPMIPPAIGKIISYLAPLQFHDSIDYKFVGNELRSIRKDRNSESSEEGMDWSGKLEHLLIEAKKNAKKLEVPKGEETLMLERMEKARRGKRTPGQKGVSPNDTQNTKTVTREGEGSEGPPATFFNEGALHTQTTAGGTEEIQKVKQVSKSKRKSVVQKK